MKLLHKKSQCCDARIVRFGGKRRQCTVCKKTWSEHPAKRGPKHPRKQYHYLKKVFKHGMKVKHLALHSRLSVDVVYKRFTNNLNAVVTSKRIVRVRGEKLIIIIDAQWHYFERKLWTLYFVAVRSTNSQTATILDPILRPGKENAKTWDELFNNIPLGIKNRVIALVSDGIRGIDTVADDNNWIHQRCHFHLLSLLQKMRGKRSSTPGRHIREEIYCTVELVLSETSKRKLNTLCKRLVTLSEMQGCPKRMKMAVREFLRRLPKFRSYLDYPDLHLPTTVNVMESINSFVRERSAKTRTPNAWHKWAIACIRLKSKFTCK
jgi:hypothetical protein